MGQVGKHNQSFHLALCPHSQRDSQRDGTKRDCTGRYGTERRDLHNRRLPVRFLSHLPLNPEFMGGTALSAQRTVHAAHWVMDFVVQQLAPVVEH